MRFVGEKGDDLRRRFYQLSKFVPEVRGLASEQPLYGPDNLRRRVFLNRLQATLYFQKLLGVFNQLLASTHRRVTIGQPSNLNYVADLEPSHNFVDAFPIPRHPAS